MRGLVRATAIALLVVALLALTGCGMLAQKAAESATGVSVQKNGSQVTVNGPNGSATVQTNESKLPDGLPDNVPTYSGTIKGSNAVTTPEGSTFTYTVVSADDAKTIVDWYAKNLADKGWTVDQTLNMPNGGVVSAKVGTTSSLAVTVHDDNGQRNAVVIVTVKK